MRRAGLHDRKHLAPLDRYVARGSGRFRPPGLFGNLYTLVSDTAPRQIVSSIIGIGGMAGAIGGMFIAKLAGYILEKTGDYRLLFLIAACAYLVNLTIIHVLNPRLEPMKFEASRNG